MNNNIPERFFDLAQKNPNKYTISFKKKNKWLKIKNKKIVNIVKRTAANIQSTLGNDRKKIAILSENRWEWLITDLAILSSNNIVVPIHSTNSLEVNNYILQNSDSELLFISGEQFSKYDIHQLLDKTNIKKVIVYDKNYNAPTDLNKIEILSFKKFFYSRKTDQYSTPKINPEDICYIFYTSGTTGHPKGVQLTHKNIVANVDQISDAVKIFNTDVFLSFLPYSHALEHTAGFFIPLFNGASVVLAENIDKLGDNLKEIKPTVMIVVPRIFEKVYDKILNKVDAGSPIKKKLFYWALKTQPENRSIKRLIANKLVFQKIRDNLGGNIRFFVSGGSSLSQEIAEFFYKAELMILEGYGLTETSPVLSVNRMTNFTFGTVGTPLNDTQIRLGSDDELLVKGPQVTHGYYKAKKQTQEAFDHGWFKTGDIVKTDKNNFITIVDRKKEIIVLSTGKNVSPQNVENHLNLNKYIQASMVYGDNEKVLQAMIVPDFDELKKWLDKQHDLHIITKNNFIVNKEIINLYSWEIKKALQNLGKHEQVGKIKITKRAFLQDKNELTPTLKLKRKQILKTFQL